MKRIVPTGKKRFFLSMVLLMVISCNGLGQFSGSSQLSGHGIQLKIELEPPIQINQPVPVIITLETEEDMSGMEVFLSTSGPTIQILDDRELWIVDTKAHSPVVLTTTVKFTNEGSFNITAFAKDSKTAKVIEDTVSLYVTQTEAVVNPTPKSPPESIEDLPKEIPLVENEAGPLVAATVPSTPEPLPSPAPIVEVHEYVDQNDLPIPDDGNWVTMPLTITNIPAQSQVIEVLTTFTIDHPQGQELVMELVGPDGATSQRLWDREIMTADDLDKGLLYRNISGITAFNHLPAAGIWSVRVRDDVGGQQGEIDSFSLIIRYRLPASVDTPLETPTKSPLPEPPVPPESTPIATPPDDEQQLPDESGMVPNRRDLPRLAQADIEAKALPGQVTARGCFFYYDRQDNLQPAIHTPVYLYDKDPTGSDDYLGVDVTGSDGCWQIGPILNRDDPGAGTLDLFAIKRLSTQRRTVSYPNGLVYAWESRVHSNVSDGLYDFYNSGIGNDSDEEGAMWIFQDMYRAWARPHPDDPGQATVRWQTNVTSLLPCTGDSCFWPYSPVDGVFLITHFRMCYFININRVGKLYACYIGRVVSITTANSNVYPYL